MSSPNKSNAMLMLFIYIFPEISLFKLGFQKTTKQTLVVIFASTASHQMKASLELYLRVSYHLGPPGRGLPRS